jgi:hypothetical protein
MRQISAAYVQAGTSYHGMFFCEQPENPVGKAPEVRG